MAKITVNSLLNQIDCAARCCAVLVLGVSAKLKTKGCHSAACCFHFFTINLHEQSNNPRITRKGPGGSCADLVVVCLPKRKRDDAAPRTLVVKPMGLHGRAKRTVNLRLMRQDDFNTDLFLLCRSDKRR